MSMNGFKKMSKKMISFLFVFLCISVLSITVGFSAMSTTLTVNGNVAFKPVDMIRVTNLEKDTLQNAEEISAKYTINTINVLADINSSDGYAIYNVKIVNFGEIDKELFKIEEEIFSNEDMEYEFEGIEEGQVIKAKEEVEFKLIIRPKDSYNDSSYKRINAKFKFLFDDYTENIDDELFPIVFEQSGACTFNGSNNLITGDECTKYADKKFIDTGIALYSMENYQKDYEIGFTIDEYTPSNQEGAQTVFVNTKKEAGQEKAPGLVVRRSESTGSIEITQSIGNTKEAITFPSSSVKNVRIIRKDNIVYYSINNGELKKLQDMSSFTDQHNFSTTFGAANTVDNEVFRYLNGTLSNMYIRLGKYQARQFTLTFNANGGSVDEETRNVSEFEKIGDLPVPTNGNKIFDGWYTGLDYKTRIDENTIINGDTTCYAKWNSLGNVEIDGNYYKSLAEAITSLNSSSDEVTIVLHEDISDSVTIPSGMNIILDFENHTISNKNNNAVIENKGNLTIVDGTFTSNGTTAIINNKNTGVLNISGGSFMATGTKQAIYNDGGTMIISGDAYFSSTSSIRTTIHNLNKGKMTILGGTIESTNYSALNNESGTVTIGSKDGMIDSTPIIKGNNYGALLNADTLIYDGAIKGKNGAIDPVKCLCVFLAGGGGGYYIYRKLSIRKKDKKQEDKAETGLKTLAKVEDEATELLFDPDAVNLEKENFTLVSDEYPCIRIENFPFYIGKDADHMDFCLREQGISRYHLKFDRNGDRLYVSDLNSTNGSFVNGEKIEPDRPVCVHKGDSIALGKCVYRLE